MVSKDEAKEILLSNNPELKIIYKENELDEIVDGLCKDINYVRKTLKEVNMLIAKYEKSNP